MKKLLLVVLAVAAMQANKAQTNFNFSAAGKDLRIEFCTSSMFRVRVSWNKMFEAPEPWMVVKYNWAPVIVKRTDRGDNVQLETQQLVLNISKSTLKIDVLDKQGHILSSEKNTAKNGDAVQCTKQLFADEHFFGFGERMDFLDRRGKSVKLNVGRGKGMPHIIGAYNVLEANYSPIPFFMSTKGYGIFFHNAFPTQWDMGSAKNDAYSFSADGGELDYYFIYGPKFPAVLDQYTSLTGRAPLMPKAGYGLHVGTYSGGTWGYERFSSDKYVIELARKLREMGIPVDLLWLDSTWRIFGKVGGKGATSFEWRETFKDPKGMFDSLYAMHYKMVGLHLRPRFDNGNKIKLLDTAQQLKYTYPEGNYVGEFVNFFDPASTDFWWEHGVKRVADVGARFLKTDEGSAFGGMANESDKTGPQGKDIAKLHNLFPLAYAKAPYEKFQQYNNLRGLNQTREGYAGIQRYPYIFAGDWPSEWQYFGPVIKAGLNIGLSGVGNWTHCMGGFEHPADPELYIRWVQFGMLSPIAMVFGMDHPGYKEPWAYGEDGLRNFKKYDSLRYQLLPYIYSYAYKMYKTGAPLMRALVLDYQDDPNVYEITDQYLFGEELMVCPVTTKGAQTRTVYLPGGEWYDWWTGKKYSGKQYVHVVTPLDVMPIFAKAGAIIPMQPFMNYVGEKKVDTITLNVFPGTGNFTLYDDDGESLDYQKGKFTTTDISVQGTKVSINNPAHKYIIKLRAKEDLAIAPGTLTDNSVTLLWQKSGSAYDILLNDKPYASTSKTNHTITQLSPNSWYTAKVNGNSIKFKTAPKGKIFNILNYGAKNDTTTLNTRPIQAAINACTEGGTVYVPKGTYVSGALFLKSNMTLYIEKGAVLKGSAALDDYLPMIPNRFEGWEMKTYASLLNAGTLDRNGGFNVKNLRITGGGTISGGGKKLGNAMIRANGLRSRGRLILLMNCRDVSIDNLTLTEPASWTLHYIYSNNISCHDLNIVTNVRNGDGIDPDSSTNSYIFNCTFDTGDDCIAIKSGKNPEGYFIAKPTQNVQITNCDFKRGHGISIGSEMSGGVSDVLVQDCKAGNLLHGMQIKGTKERGGYVRNVTVTDCALLKISIFSALSYNNDGEAAPQVPVFENFVFKNIDMTGAKESDTIININGFKERPLQQITLNNIKLPDNPKVVVNDAEQVNFINVKTISGKKVERPSAAP